MELKPCPFCGGKAEPMKWTHGSDEPGVSWAVKCSAIGCGIRSSLFGDEDGEGLSDATEHWNRRAPSPSGEAVEPRHDRQASEGLNDWGDEARSVLAPSPLVERLRSHRVALLMPLDKWADVADGLLEEAAAALTASPAKGEAVAWQYRYVKDGGRSTDWGEHNPTLASYSDYTEETRPLYAAPLSVSTPQGWKLVPIEPTEAMLATQGKSRPDLATTEWSMELAKRLNASMRQDAREIWADMLAAASE